MRELFDLEKPAGQFRAMVLLWGVAVGLRCAGFEWIAQDHTLILGSLLTLLRAHLPAPTPPHE